MKDFCCKCKEMLRDDNLSKDCFSVNGDVIILFLF